MASKRKGWSGRSTRELFCVRSPDCRSNSKSPNRTTGPPETVLAIRSPGGILPEAARRQSDDFHGDFTAQSCVAGQNSAKFRVYTISVAPFCASHRSVHVDGLAKQAGCLRGVDTLERNRRRRGGHRLTPVRASVWSRPARYPFSGV